MNDKQSIKKMTLTPARGLRAVAGLLLGILGATVSGCVTALYGAPYASFRVTGKVTGSGNRQGIPGIRVTATRDVNDDGEPDVVALLTSDESGNWSIETGGQNPQDMTVELLFEDPDGTENGLWAEKRVTVSVSAEEFTDTDKSQWSTGQAQKKLDVVLDLEAP